MADLRAQIRADVKAAMRRRDKARLAVLRLIEAALKQKEVDERVELDKSGVVAVLGKLAKQHRDSIDQFEQAGRDDLVEKERFELEVVQSYLPQPLDEEEVRRIIQDVVKATGAESMRDMGRVMGLLKPKLQGRADMAKVSALVKAQLGLSKF